ncbi:MAG: glycosyltransferase family protein [Nitrospirota bacterium]|nr:glycosyltransferase family protein [Nitrospirota bacterium]MDE3034749.1 glycosyltransferase family protein [Nitrospirota bacterium]MDE3117965.1 glycosyltransferase family protein [Nitrospirota bacterium]MDE3225719.1 glycosyltransferase family protein [Nitrospirota bacterium]MDE3241125.1 glycosyltransferase family protein [Nitrospirota bacterium]
MTVTAIIQARMGSSRLPGKVLAPILGQPMLWHMLQRLKHAARLGQILVATTDKPEDRPITELAASLGIASFTGSEQDVLDRYYRAARTVNADPIVRLTADCPLIDPHLVDQVVEEFVAHRCDHAALAGTYPDGLDTEIVTFEALSTAWREAVLPSEREHVTPFIWTRPERFRLRQIRSTEDYSVHRWTVDDPRDLELVRAIFGELYQEGRLFFMRDVLSLLARRPDLAAINRGITRNEGYRKSLQEDAAWVTR